MRDLFRRGGRLSWRRFGVLVRGLPSTSLTKTILRDTTEFEDDGDETPKFGPWALEHYQNATVIDAMQKMLVLLRAQLPREFKMPEMEPVPRPILKVTRRINEEERDRLDRARALLDLIRDRQPMNVHGDFKAIEQ